MTSIQMAKQYIEIMSDRIATEGKEDIMIFLLLNSMVETHYAEAKEKYKMMERIKDLEEKLQLAEAVADGIQSRNKKI